MAVTDHFGELTESWQEEMDLPWSRMRYELYRRNLQSHIGDVPLKVLDFGGGTGEDAIYLAKLGHQVTLLDCSATMLEHAKLSAQEQGELDRITFLHTQPESDLAMLEDDSFDLILCHMMIEFVSDGEGLLARLCELLSPEGLLSIVDTNRYSDVYMQALQFNNLSEAANSIELKMRYHPWANRVIPRYAAQDLIPVLKDGCCSVVGHYGLLSLCAYLPNGPKFDPDYYQELLALETRLTDQYPYYLLAKFFQLIVKKNQK